jgi:hypothetical protein
MSRSKRGALLSRHCAICGEPVWDAGGKLILDLRRIYAVHTERCEETFERAVEAALQRAVWGREMER